VEAPVIDVFRRGVAWFGGVRVLSLLVAAMSVALSGMPVHAAKIPLMFGTSESLTEIQPLETKGPNGEALFLGYKTSRHAFLLPYRLTDDGYVVGIQGTQSFFRLDADKIKSMSATGQLPNPLPPYSIPLLDYAFGHSVWAIPLIIGLIAFVSMRGDARRKRALPFLETGQLHHRNNDLDSAIADYTEAIETDHKLGVAYFNRGVAYRQQGALQKAIGDFSKTLSFEPKSPMVLLERGMTFSQMGLHQPAIGDFTRMLKLDKTAFGYFTRGQAYAANGEHTRAIKDFSAAIQAEPSVGLAYQARAQSHLASGNAQLAQADAQRAGELGVVMAAPA
jgi:tetratricopeptide (TPR) repeat protein